MLLALHLIFKIVNDEQYIFFSDNIQMVLQNVFVPSYPATMELSLYYH